MKYVDAEKLIELLEEMKRAEYENCGGVNSKTGALQEIQELIDSLQQEQPEKTLTFGGFVDKVGTWFAHLRLDKFRKTFDGETFPATELVQRYDLFVRELTKQYSDKQEQPEVDLEKELIEWHKRHFKKTGTYEKYSGFYLENSSQLDLARHFYKLGHNAKKED